VKCALTSTGLLMEGVGVIESLLPEWFSYLRHSCLTRMESSKS
jgi:hypothetical protein